MKNHLLASLLLIIAATAIDMHPQTYKVLYSFSINSGQVNSPSGNITQGRRGELVGTGNGLHSGDVGGLFSITPQGVVTLMYEFWQFGTISPDGGVTLSTDGYYYGTTMAAGAYGNGSVFKMNAHGSFTRLYDFTNGLDGAWPQAAPIQSIGGNFFGTVGSGGTGNYGSIYKISASGLFTVLHSFGNADGANPYAPLVQGNDGNFYGTTYRGGANDLGTIFKITPWGNLTVLFDFDGSQGSNPYAPLVQGSDGAFYGVTSAGGPSGAGTAFRMSPAGNVTVLHNFTGTSDGGFSLTGLVEATDGNFYGVNLVGGAYGLGVIFRLTPTGTVTVVHDYDSKSKVPLNPLIQHTNGLFYGGTRDGGTGAGTFYSLDVGLKPFVTFLPASTRVGSNVQVLGQGFTGTTLVLFNGVPAKFSVIFDTYLVATVPAGVTTGFITVTTPTGTLKSNKKFVVMP